MIIQLVMVILLEEQSHLVCVPSLSDTMNICSWFASSAVQSWWVNLSISPRLACFCSARKLETRKNVMIFNRNDVTKVSFNFFFLVVSYAGVILSSLRTAALDKVISWKWKIDSASLCLVALDELCFHVFVYLLILLIFLAASHENELYSLVLGNFVGWHLPFCLFRTFCILI